VLVDTRGDVLRLESPVSERNLTNVVAFVRKLSPREVIRAVLSLPDDDVLPLCRPVELRRHESSG